MPLVSVIIPTYNRALFIKKAIQSVLKQTYTDHEIIVVDDGSTDNTAGLVAELSNQDSRIRYVRQNHGGISIARNTGIKLAMGEYVSFLDSDDEFLPEKLEIQVRALEDNPDFAMVYSSYIAINEVGTILGNVHEGKSLSGWIYPQLLFISACIITTSTIIVRASVLREIGGFDETMKRSEDLDLWRRIARHYKILQIEKPLSVYRLRSGDVSDRNFMYVDRKSRIYYYKKAIREDITLSKSIQRKLIVELFNWHTCYSVVDINIPLTFHLFTECAKLDPLFSFLLFPGYVRNSLLQCFYPLLKPIVLYLRKRLSARDFNLLKKIYKRIMGF